MISLYGIHVGCHQYAFEAISLGLPDLAQATSENTDILGLNEHPGQNIFESEELTP